MNTKEKNLLKEIEKDCIKLKRTGQLHEYGEGQLDLIALLKEKGITIPKS